MSSRVKDFHDPAFDPLVTEINKFGADELGMQFLPPDRVTVVPLDIAEQWRAAYPTFNGGYNLDTHRVVILERRVKGKPLTSMMLLASFLVHEGTHSASYNPDEHYIFNETIAGLAEHCFLGTQRLHVPESFILTRAGVEVTIPGSFRYADAAEFQDEPNKGDKGLHASQGLIIAAGIVPLLTGVGLTEKDVLSHSTLGGSEQFDMIRDALHAHKPGLVEKIQKLPSNIDGVVQALSHIQNA